MYKPNEKLNALFAKARNYRKNTRFDRALEYYNRVLGLQKCKEAYQEIGLIYVELHDLDKAKEYFNKANDSNIPYLNGKHVSNDPTCIHNLASIEYIMFNDIEAMRLYKIAYSLDHNNYAALLGYGQSGIRRYCEGDTSIDLKQMWKYYTYRFMEGDLTIYRPHDLWDGITPHLSESIVVLRDQGQGDALMFSRYLPELQKYFKKIYMQVAPELECLYENIYDANSDCKYAIPIGNLPQLLDYIPAGDWLANRNIYEKHDGLRVGCVWGGNNLHKNHSDRACPPSYFDNLEYDKYSFVPRVGYTFLEWKNWDDTIYWLNKLDVVVTVDTSMVHMCGCLGKPCIMIMPLISGDFRWGRSDKTIWYSSVNIVHNNDSWSEAFKEVRKRLDEFASKHTS
jgi:tetratricopeptide (TPR) repeat protein